MATYKACYIPPEVMANWIDAPVDEIERVLTDSSCPWSNWMENGQMVFTNSNPDEISQWFLSELAD